MSEFKRKTVIDPFKFTVSLQEMQFSVLTDISVIFLYCALMSIYF
jgi:hypothetical protein